MTVIKINTICPYMAMLLVGQATRRAVVVTFLLCLVLGYIITWFFFKVLDTGP